MNAETRTAILTYHGTENEWERLQTAKRLIEQGIDPETVCPDCFTSDYAGLIGECRCIEENER